MAATIPPPLMLTLFDPLLAALRRDGFQVGVDERARLQILLERLPPDRKTGDLATLLCPIFAGSPEQQERFYELYQDFVGMALIDPPLPEPETLTNRPSAALSFGTVKPRYLLSARPIIQAAVLVIVALTLTLFHVPPPASQRGKTILSPIWASGQNHDAGRNGNPAKVITKPTPATPLSVTISVTEAPPARKPVQIPVPPRSWKPFGRVILPLTIALGLGVVALLEWLKAAHRRRTLEELRQRKKAPPFQWRFSGGPAESVHDRETVSQTATQMRRPRIDEARRVVDLPQTIRRTIDAAGYRVQVDRPVTRTREYVALIQRRGFNDHLAHLYSVLVEALRRENLYLQTFFYSDTPQVCCREVGSCRTWDELQEDFRGARLLLFGDADDLIDPVNGRLANWAARPMVWETQTLLTSRPLLLQGAREDLVRERFEVLPATLDGLRVLAQRRRLPMGEADDEFADLPPPEHLEMRYLVPALRTYLGRNVFEWLCALAAYHERNWDLTLAMGEAMAASINEAAHKEDEAAPKIRLLTETNLLHLATLPWFQKGALPFELRQALLSCLTPPQRSFARTVLIVFLWRRRPPRRSFAYDAFLLEISLQIWLRRRDDRASVPTDKDRHRLTRAERRLRQAVERVPRQAVLENGELVNALRQDDAETVIGRAAARVRRALSIHGIPLFGWKLGTRLSAAVAAVVVVIAVLSLGHTQRPPRAGVKEISSHVAVLNSLPRIDFGVRKLGSEAVADVQISNKSQEQLLITSLKIEPPGQGFTVAGLTNHLTIPPGGNRSWQILFHPATNGGISATLRLTSSAFPHDARIPLKGIVKPIVKGIVKPIVKGIVKPIVKGIVKPIVKLTIKPDTINFGKVPLLSSSSPILGNLSDAKSVTISNNSDQTQTCLVRIASAVGTAPPASPFSVAPSSVTVPLHGKASVSVKFVPTAEGAQTGSLNIFLAGDLNAVQSIPLSGSGQRPGQPTIQSFAATFTPKSPGVFVPIQIRLSYSLENGTSAYITTRPMTARIDLAIAPKGRYDSVLAKLGFSYDGTKDVNPEAGEYTLHLVGAEKDEVTKTINIPNLLSKAKLVFSPSGKLVAAVSTRDLTAMTQPSDKRAFFSRFWTIALSPPATMPPTDMGSTASTPGPGFKGSITLWHADLPLDKTPFVSVQLDALTPVRAIAFSHDDHYVVVCGGNSLSLFQVSDGRRLHTWPNLNPLYLSAVAFTRDDRNIIASDRRVPDPDVLLEKNGDGTTQGYIWNLTNNGLMPLISFSPLANSTVTVHTISQKGNEVHGLSVFYLEQAFQGTSSTGHRAPTLSPATLELPQGNWAIWCQDAAGNRGDIVICRVDAKKLSVAVQIPTVAAQVPDASAHSQSLHSLHTYSRQSLKASSSKTIPKKASMKKH